MVRHKLPRRAIAGPGSRDSLEKKEVKVTAKEFADSVVRIYDKQVQEGKRGAAHNAQHMLRTAIAAADYVMKKANDYNTKYKKQLARVAAATGLLHDLVRIPHEIEGREDGIVSADLIEHMTESSYSGHEDVRIALTQLVEQHSEELETIRDFLRSFGNAQLAMMARTIRANEGNVNQILESAKGLHDLGRDEEAILYEALMFGDKGVEGLGPSVVVRRAQFVSGERAENPGDIGALRHDVLQHAYSEIEYRLLAFIGESMIRIYSGKKLSDFPAGPMWDKVKQSREFELKVYRALLEHFDIRYYQSEDDLFRYLLNMEFPKMAKSEEKISKGIEKACKAAIDGCFVTDAVSLVLGLAYTQSKDQILRAKAESYLRRVENGGLRNAAASSDIHELKERFASYFAEGETNGYGNTTK